MQANFDIVAFSKFFAVFGTPNVLVLYCQTIVHLPTFFFLQSANAQRLTRDVSLAYNFAPAKDWEQNIV